MVQDNRWAMLGFCVASISVSASLIGGIGSIVFSGLNQQITDLKADNKDMHLTLATLLTLNAQVKAYDAQFTRTQLDLNGKLDRDVFDTSRSSILQRIEELTNRQGVIESKLVPREENALHWLASDALTLRVNALSDRQCK